MMPILMFEGIFRPLLSAIACHEIEGLIASIHGGKSSVLLLRHRRQRDDATLADCKIVGVGSFGLGPRARPGSHAGKVRLPEGAGHSPLPAGWKRDHRSPTDGGVLG